MEPLINFSGALEPCLFWSGALEPRFFESARGLEPQTPLGP